MLEYIVPHILRQRLDDQNGVAARDALMVLQAAAGDLEFG
jgi:hypothetical protein